MASRLKLQEELETLLGSDSVYFQPPASVRMTYPCIKYSLAGIESEYADDKNYKTTKRYEVMVIDRDPDSEIHETILAYFPMCSFDRSYVADNLNHFVLTLYY